jgi:hypothetical protein
MLIFQKTEIGIIVSQAYLNEKRLQWKLIEIKKQIEKRQLNEKVNLNNVNNSEYTVTAENDIYFFDDSFKSLSISCSNDSKTIYLNKADSKISSDTKNLISLNLSCESNNLITKRISTIHSLIFLIII